MSWKNRRESARVYLVIALSYACGNLKTVLKVWSQLLENFHYHGSVRNAKLLNWTVFDRLLPPPRGRQNSRPRYKLWFRRAPVLPCLRFQQTEHQNWLVIALYNNCSLCDVSLCGSLLRSATTPVVYASLFPWKWNLSDRQSHITNLPWPLVLH